MKVISDELLALVAGGQPPSEGSGSGSGSGSSGPCPYMWVAQYTDDEWERCVQAIHGK
jgi:hypothetical protein